MHCIYYICINRAEQFVGGCITANLDLLEQMIFVGVVSQMQPEDFFAFVDTYITYSFVSCPSPSQVEGFLILNIRSDDF